MNAVFSALLGECWAMEATALERLAQVIVRWSDGVRLDAAAISAAVGAGPARANERPVLDQSVQGVAVLPLLGVMAHRAHMVQNVSGPGGTSTELFGRAFQRAVEDSDVRAIVIDIDSPGGAVSGTPELASMVKAGRERKPVIGVANATAASAAYWILANCTEAVVTPSGLVGSIGVLAVHEDRSGQLANQGRRITYIHAGRYKAEGNPAEPLSDDARSEMQRVVNQFYRTMVSNIAAGRGVSTSVVAEQVGQGRVLTAQDALAVRMVDRIETLEQTISRILVSPDALWTHNAGRSRGQDRRDDQEAGRFAERPGSAAGAGGRILRSRRTDCWLGSPTPIDRPRCWLGLRSTSRCRSCERSIADCRIETSGRVWWAIKSWRRPMRNFGRCARCSLLR